MPAGIVSCQGSAQLVTALAASAARGSGDACDADFLVIHDLASPRDEEKTFTRAIRQAAEVLRPWRKIVAIPNREKKQWSPARLRKELGNPDPALLYLNSFPTVGGRLIRAAFPNAKRVVFGDSIGLNFSPGYFAPSQPRRVLAWTLNAVRTIATGRALSAVGCPFADNRADECHLLLPGLFDQPAPPHVRIRRDDMLALFGQLAAAPSLRIGAVAKRLEAAIAASDRTLLLLTSNFSETARMTLSAEVSEYLRITHQHNPTPRTLVVIKPHPRDSREKLEKVTQAIGNDCMVAALTDSTVAYLPFEAILSRLLQEQPVLRSKLTGVCVSTACLALEFLYGIPCTVGFGPAGALRFARSWRRQRAQHEEDLRNALARIRSGEFGRVSC